MISNSKLKAKMNMIDSVFTNPIMGFYTGNFSIANDYSLIYNFNFRHYISGFS
jgi:hypothetical protein